MVRPKIPLSCKHFSWYHLLHRFVCLYLMDCSSVCLHPAGTRLRSCIRHLPSALKCCSSADTLRSYIYSQTPLNTHKHSLVSVICEQEIWSPSLHITIFELCRMYTGISQDKRSMQWTCFTVPAAVLWRTETLVNAAVLTADSSIQTRVKATQVPI